MSFGHLLTEHSPVDAAALRVGLGAVREGIIIASGAGSVLYRNESADRLIARHPARAHLEGVVLSMVRRAAAGEESSETLELYGPPRRTLRICSYVRGDREEAAAVAVLIEDVTENRRLEAMRRDFIANISHELKTPVGALALLAETLLDESDPLVISRLAGRIQMEAQRISRIMDDLLDLSRIESEAGHLEEPVPVLEMVTEALERIHAAAEQQQITLTVGTLPEDEIILGDRRQLVSALYNLLENAVKYSDPGSSIEVDGDIDAGDIEIRVHDRGIGIASHDLDRIFERFYRVDRARSRETGGTGLGLAIVRHVVTNHGGKIHVRSVEGVGSTFTLRLPAVPPVLSPERAEEDA
jgi:two-component system, OmpR family, sensor histidine kinase SenX3